MTLRASADEWAKSKRARVSAERNAAAGDYDTAANRLYYAALHAAKAVLLTQGLEPKTHRGVKQLLVVHFIAKELLPDWLEPALSRLETERDLADYAAGFEVSAARYGACRIEAERLLGEVERYLESSSASNGPVKPVDGVD